MTANHHRKFLGMPQTRLGQWAVGLSALFVVLFVLKLAGFLPFPAMLIMGLGIVAGILTLVVIIWKRERSWLVWLVLLPGLFAIIFSVGEILFPH